MASKLLLAVILLNIITSIPTASTFRDSAGIDGQVHFVIPEGAANVKEDRERICNAFGILGNCESDDNDPIDAFEDGLSAKRQLIWAYERYISYMAMRKNSIPCSQRGCSYYNCHPGQAVNPYHRGCSAITRCARVW